MSLKKKINKFCSKKIQNIYFASFQKRLFINQPYFFPFKNETYAEWQFLANCKV